MPSRSRVASSLLAFALVCLSTFPCPPGHARNRKPSRLVVHEWGTFTCKMKDGVALRWSPEDTPTDLPRFVYQWLRDGKTKIEGTVRMETPVVYFYTDKPQVVTLKVDFPNGRITEWYPQGDLGGAGIEWKQFKLLPGTAPELPREAGENHYYAARETDSVPLRVQTAETDQFEKFLFYRGVGTFDLPVSAKLDGETVLVKKAGAGDIGSILLFENRGGRIEYRLSESLDAELRVERPFPGGTLESFQTDLKHVLVESGLFEKEAAAMIKTWEKTWSEPGLRVFYVVPEDLTNVILPLTVKPKPAKVVRVLVGRVEIL